MVEPDWVTEILRDHSPYFEISHDGKYIKCLLNNHEFPLNREIVETFIRGKKYKKLKASKDIEDDMKKYEPFLVASVNYPAMLFCSLTNQLIKKRHSAVQEHLRGKKFTRAKEKFQNDEIELFEEPTIEEMEAAIEEMEQDAGEMLEEDMRVDEMEETQDRDDDTTQTKSNSGIKEKKRMLRSNEQRHRKRQDRKSA